jgi:hypothetical protein
VPIIKIEVDDELAQELEADSHIQAFGASKFFELAIRFYLKCKVNYDLDKQYERAYSDPRVREEFEREMKLWESAQAWPD